MQAIVIINAVVATMDEGFGGGWGLRATPEMCHKMITHYWTSQVLALSFMVPRALSTACNNACKWLHW
eukprot:COSAG03_NODE_12125_length_560_cov_0.783080_1_plen_67_part_10